MGGGGGGQPTQSTSYQTNLPEYAQPYVETMLGATQQQLFNTQQTPEGATEITGFKPYTPYSANPQDYIAGFSPMQQAAQQQAAGMGPSSAYGQAQGIAGMAGLGQFGTAGQAGMYGRQGMGIGQMGLAGAMPAFGAGQQYAQQVTDPRAVGSYMSPYMQNVVDVQKAAAVREAQMANTAQNLASARSGTYGGARQALAQAERERNLMSNLSNIQAQGSQNAYNQALQNMQYGANLGLQGISTGLQGIAAGQQGVSQGLAGIGAQQAGYAGAGAQASNLANLAGQQQAADVNRINLQNQMGQQQQQQQQAIINQAVQDYATQQQYPLMQLGFMSNMLRGLPMQATTTQSYMPVANPLTAGIGTAGALASLGSAFGGGKAAGGEIKSYAKGGIASYDVGGNVKSDLYKMDVDELEEIAKNTSSDVIRKDAQRIAKMKSMGLAGGGIIAFADGKTVSGNRTAEDYQLQDSEELKARREADLAAALALKAERDGTAPTTGSIMFDQMKDRPSAPSGIVLQRPEDFKAPVSAAPVATTRPQKGWEALLGIDPNAKPSRGIIASGGPKDIDAEIAAEANAPLVANEVSKVSNKIDASGRNDKGELPGEGTRKDEKPAAKQVVAEKKDTGIKAAAPTTTRAARTEGVIPGLSPTMQAIYDLAKGEKEQSVADYMKDIRKARAETIGVDKGAQEDRQRAMAEKANLVEQQKKERALEETEFWAKFATMPGNTINAGMTALKGHIPEMIKNERDRRKAMAEADNVIRTINKSIRAEEEGDFDQAFKLKKDAANKAADLNKSLLAYQATIEAANTKASKSDLVSLEKLKLQAMRERNAAVAKKEQLKSSKAYQAAEFDSKLPADSKDAGIKARREKGIADKARMEEEFDRIIQDADDTLESIRKHGGIPMESNKREKSSGSEPKVRKWNEKTGQLEA